MSSLGCNLLGEEPIESLEVLRRGVAAALNNREQRTNERLTAFEQKMRAEASDIAGSRMVEIDRKIQHAIGPLSTQIAELRGAQEELSGLIRQMLGLDAGRPAGPGRAVPVRAPYGLPWWRRWFR